MERVALLAEDEVALGIGNVVARHRCQRLDERHAAGRVELVLDAAVDDDDVARRQLLSSRRQRSSSTAPSTIHITCSVVSWLCRRTVVPGS